ncbi:hypothetical protein [Longimicrobium sp.]|jgi:hypothetical protein|uniref:hypothetical protein n=1 Tax=Longimicrobium sp. TaxID=2029185 RepID=UPI002EDB85F3
MLIDDLVGYGSIAAGLLSVAVVAWETRATRHRIARDVITITITDAAGRRERMVAHSGKGAKELLRDVERAVHTE